MAENNLKKLINTGDIYAALRTKYGSNVVLQDYQVSNVVKNLEGLTSLVLRVNVIYKLNNNHQINSTSFIIKRYPILQEQLKLVNECKLFEREVVFYNEILPILQQKHFADNLSIVKCYLAHNDIIILEDLKPLRYDILSKHLCDFTPIKMGIEHLRLITRKVAEYHAASLDTDWMKLYPQYLKQDAYLESGNGILFKHIVKSTNNTLIQIIKDLYPIEKSQKYIRWLNSPECYSRLIRLTKFNRNFVNVLCHGDFWENNVLFKLQHVSNKPLDIKIIDFQLFRFAPGSTDLILFLYGCTDKTFRDKYENELIDIYVNAFNSYVCTTPDKTSFNKFKEQYEFHRLLGMYVELVYKPIRRIIDNKFIEQNDINKEVFDILFNDNTKYVIDFYNENKQFKIEFNGMIEELVTIIDKLGF